MYFIYVISIHVDGVYNFFLLKCLQQWGSACSDDAQLIEMTPKIKATILATHNKHRNNIAGGQISGFETAAKMATIVSNWHFLHIID